MSRGEEGLELKEQGEAEWNMNEALESELLSKTLKHWTSAGILLWPWAVLQILSRKEMYSEFYQSTESSTRPSIKLTLTDQWL